MLTDFPLPIANNLPGIIFSWQPTTGLEYINAAVEACLGYTPAELQQDPNLLSNLIHPTGLKKVKKIVADLLSEPLSASGTFLVCCYHKTGKFVWLSVNLSSTTQGANGPIKLLGVAQNVTGQQKHHHTLKLQATFLSHLRSSLFVTNLQGQIILWNEGAANLFDQDIQDSWGQPLRDLLNIEVKEEETLLNKLISQNYLSCEFSLETKKKEPFWVDLSGHVLQDESGKPIGFLFNPTDVTRQKVSDTLREISAVLVSSLQLEKTLSIILESLDKLLKFDSAAIYLLTPNNRLRMVNGKGMPYIEVTLASATEIDVFPLDEAVISSKSPLAVADVRKDERWTALKGTEYIRSWLGVPLLFRGEPLGQLTIDRATIDPFTEDQISLAEAFAGHAAIALQNAELFSRVQFQQERLRRLTNRVVTAQEDERRRISRELHDEMGQALTALKLNLQMLAAAIPPEETLIARLKELVTLANDSLQEVRRLAVDLRPAMLDDLGLVPTLRWYRDQYQKRSTCYVSLSIIPDLPRLSPKTETALYRIVQEALTNVSRHAEAENVEIFLSMDDKMIYFSIIDDGKGFSRESNDRLDSLGVGLIGMLERIEDLQGQFDISSVPGEGTHISITIPCEVALSYSS